MSADAPSHGGRNTPAAVFFWRILRITIAVALLSYATRGVDWPLVWRALAAASWKWMSLAVLLVVADRVLMAWRWVALVRIAEPHRPLPLPSLLRVFFVSTFAGSFLPGSVGGDALRAVAVSRLGVSTANAVASVAVDRLLGTLSVLLMSAVGVWLVGLKVDSRLAPVAAVATIVAGAVTYGLLFDDRLYRWMLNTAGIRRWPTLDRLAHKFLAAVGQYGQHHGPVSRVLAASIVVQVLRTLQTWCLGLGLGLAVGGEWYFAAVPVIVLITLLPISIGGLGTANAAFVALFALAGVDREAAFVLSVLFLSLGVIGNLPGGLILAGGTEPLVPGAPAT